MLICMLCVIQYYFFFFFSSRRRHTRCSRDWSSDVCSSDLQYVTLTGRGYAGGALKLELLFVLVFVERTHGMGRSATSSSRRSEEHTSELQSRLHLVCRLLLEKKKKRK